MLLSIQFEPDQAFEWNASSWLSSALLWWLSGSARADIRLRF